MPTSEPKTGENRKLAERVYDMIMGRIDTDLLLENIPNLDEKYAGESEGQRAQRMEKYKVSYTKFDQDMAEFMTGVHDRSRKSKHEALKQKEQKSRQEEASELENLELSFQ